MCQKSSDSPEPKIYSAARPCLEVPEPAVLTGDEQKRKEIAQRLDTHGLLYSGKVVVDKDTKMLEMPESLAHYWDGDTTIAKEPPTVEFGIVPASPRFFGPSPRSTAGSGAYSREWSNWSQAGYYQPTGKFYATVGDTDPFDGHLYVVEYDPKTKNLRCLPELHKMLGTPDGQLRDAKIHGYLDIYEDQLWLCTYWTIYPEPAEADYATGYEGGHILSFDLGTGDMTDHGIPVKRVSWPYHRIDTKRGILYGLGFYGEFMAWDIKKRQLLYAGHPPRDMIWWWRAIMIDEVTGNVYSSYIYDPDNDVHMVKYDPHTNRFTKMETRMPHCSAKHQVIDAEKPKEVDMMRANTLNRGPDGLLWGVTKQGEMWAFDPDTEKLKAKGVNWPGLMRYTCAMERSPSGRYIYYCPGAHGMAWTEGAPVVQFDTKALKKKVIAFLHPYYSQKYGYIPSGTFSIKLDEKGESLFCLWNGGFLEAQNSDKPDFHGFFGNCAIANIRIPASERVE
ncbi:MAG: hypothetical protein A2Y12_02570 [Planctomycetes bacterium GWF2_42_9]|nr:MAG: hypothetical protein A2Y12_02570 [Planctomycetes bacterium GWF2_42_9]